MKAKHFLAPAVWVASTFLVAMTCSAESQGPPEKANTDPNADRILDTLNNEQPSLNEEGDLDTGEAEHIQRMIRIWELKRGFNLPDRTEMAGQADTDSSVAQTESTDTSDLRNEIADLRQQLEDLRTSTPSAQMQTPAGTPYNEPAGAQRPRRYYPPDSFGYGHRDWYFNRSWRP